MITYISIAGGLIVVLLAVISPLPKERKKYVNDHCGLMNTTSVKKRLITQTIGFTLTMAATMLKNILRV